MNKSIPKVPFNRPPLVGGEIDNVRLAVQSGGLGGNGEFTQRCQQWIEQRLGRGKVFLTTSCTSALEMAAIVLDIRPGDEVILPSYTFVSTVNAWLLRSATLVFVDVDPETMNIDDKLIEAAITPKTRGIVVVHYAGVPCEMDSIMSIANKHNLFVVEDAAQALTSTYKSRSLGAFGNISCFSFHETKNFTSGGQGGAISINDESLLARAEVVYDNGTNRLQFLRGLVNQYCWEDIGSNFFMSEVQAAYLWAQLERAQAVQEMRHKIWRRYALHLQPLADKGQIALPSTPVGCVHNAHMFFFKLPSLEQRTAFISYMKAAGIVASAHFVPLHSRPIGLESGRFVGEDRYTTSDSQRLVRLPLYYSMTVEQQDMVIAASAAFFAPSGRQYGRRTLKVAAPFQLTATDRATLAMTDEEFTPDTWTDVKNAIALNDLSTLPRAPSVLRRYITWTQQIIVEQGSTAQFLLQKRLCWEPSECSESPRPPILPKNAMPFADKSDYRILHNDWPYGLTSDITHLVVWLKTPFAVNEVDGKMTAESDALVKHFVNKTFVQRMRKEGAADDSVLYFRNVARLQSVGALEHFHVLLRGAKMELLDEWTDGDVPMYKR